MSDLLEEIDAPVPKFTPGSVMVPVTPDDVAALTQLSVLLRQPSMHQVFLELLRRATPSANGHGYEAICSGCGLTYQSDRRPLPGKKRWCDNCRKTGEPAAQRARAYRERKAKETK